RDVPERHQSMRRAIDASYELLNPEEQALFRRLAVFAGRWDLPAAQAVCNSAGDLPFDLLDGLTTLVECSLLVSTGQDGEPSFRMLAVLREYAEERLAASGELDEIREVNASYYEAFTTAASVALLGPGA